MDYNKLTYWLALRSIAGIGNVCFPALIDHFGSLEAIFSASITELQAVSTVTKKAALGITAFKNWDIIRKNLDLTINSGIDIVTYQDDLYPAKLLEIYDRPPLSFCQG